MSLNERICELVESGDSKELEELCKNNRQYANNHLMYLPVELNREFVDLAKSYGFIDYAYNYVSNGKNGYEKFYESYPTFENPSERMALHALQYNIKSEYKKCLDFDIKLFEKNIVEKFMNYESWLFLMKMYFGEEYVKQRLNKEIDRKEIVLKEIVNYEPLYKLLSAGSKDEEVITNLKEVLKEFPEFNVIKFLKDRMNIGLLKFIIENIKPLSQDNYLVCSDLICRTVERNQRDMLEMLCKYLKDNGRSSKDLKYLDYKFPLNQELVDLAKSYGFVDRAYEGERDYTVESPNSMYIGYRFTRHAFRYRNVSEIRACLDRMLDLGKCCINEAISRDRDVVEAITELVYLGFSKEYLCEIGRVWGGAIATAIEERLSQTAVALPCKTEK